MNKVLWLILSHVLVLGLGYSFADDLDQVKNAKVLFIEKNGKTDLYADLDPDKHKILTIPKDGTYIAFPLYGRGR